MCGTEEGVEKMNVVIYARYSSDRQTEQSIEGQLKECYEYARRNGYTVVGEYIDRAISGTTDHRPEFLRMIADGTKSSFKPYWSISLTALPATATTAPPTKPSSKRTVFVYCPPVRISLMMPLVC